MIIFIVGCVFVGILLTAFAAPIVIVMNRQKLKEMDEVIGRFQRLSPEERQEARSQLRHELAAIKKGIWSGDRQAVEAARDKLSLI